METDRDFGGDFHGSDGPIPIKRDPRSSWEPHSEAFYKACVDAGFREDEDANHPESEGVGPRPRNHIDGVRISMAIAYLDPARHRMNLTIRPNAPCRRIIFDGETFACNARCNSSLETTSTPAPSDFMRDRIA